MAILQRINFPDENKLVKYFLKGSLLIALIKTHVKLYQKIDLKIHFHFHAFFILIIINCYRVTGLTPQNVQLKRQLNSHRKIKLRISSEQYQFNLPRSYRNYAIATYINQFSFSLGQCCFLFLYLFSCKVIQDSKQIIRPAPFQHWDNQISQSLTRFMFSSRRYLHIKEIS